MCIFGGAATATELTSDINFDNAFLTMTSIVSTCKISLIVVSGRREAIHTMLPLFLLFTTLGTDSEDAQKIDLSGHFTNQKEDLN